MIHPALQLPNSSSLTSVVSPSHLSHPSRGHRPDYHTQLPLHNTHFTVLSLTTTSIQLSPAMLIFWQSLNLTQIKIHSIFLLSVPYPFALTQLKIHNLSLLCTLHTLPMFLSLILVWLKKKKKLNPGWCGSVDCTPACEPKGWWFDSQSGHMPGLWVRSPELMFLSLSFSLPSPLSKNK